MSHFEKLPGTFLHSLLSDAGNRFLGRLLQLCRGGHILPTSADYLRLSPEVCIRLDEIITRIDKGSYQHRHELLLDLIGHLMWRGRKGCKPYQPVNRYWQSVLQDQPHYMVPCNIEPSQHAPLPELKVINQTYLQLPPSACKDEEDSAYNTIYEILLQQPAGEDISPPEMQPVAALLQAADEKQVFISELCLASPIFSDDDIENCKHRNRYVQSLQRFSMLLRNSYFWCSQGVARKSLANLQKHDRVIVCLALNV